MTLLSCQGRVSATEQRGGTYLPFDEVEAQDPAVSLYIIWGAVTLSSASAASVSATLSADTQARSAFTL
eukprot:scaffold18209_cov88-Skeletonema_dohrnii-CCMP3373.AAC.2